MILETYEIQIEREDVSTAHLYWEAVETFIHRADAINALETYLSEDLDSSYRLMVYRNVWDR